MSQPKTNCAGVASVALLYDARIAQATEARIAPKGSILPNICSLKFFAKNMCQITW